MRFIIYGTGAIGGSMAVKMAKHHLDVIAIARGDMYEAIQNSGLTLHTPDGVERHDFPCVSHPSQIDFRDDDCIILTMKGQHTEEALLTLRDLGLRHQTILCLQNGVANEGRALRYFEHVLGGMVMMPATYIIPGEVYCYGSPKAGVFDIGRYPSGIDGRVEAVCAALNSCEFAAFPHENVMNAKYGKLLVNLANAIDPVVGTAGHKSDFLDRARDEARAVFAKAGITYEETHNDPRRESVLKIGKIEGVKNVGSSSAQSMARGAGSIEVDYLNGEIVHLGRLWGVPTPINAFFTQKTLELMRQGAQPGSLSFEDVNSLLAAWMNEEAVDP